VRPDDSLIIGDESPATECFSAHQRAKQLRFHIAATNIRKNWRYITVLLFCANHKGIITTCLYAEMWSPQHTFEQRYSGAGEAIECIPRVWRKE
jgi:hypothetical protein